jgi:glycosyltransferase involved in cell wall biosynthesis
MSRINLGGLLLPSTKFHVMCCLVFKIKYYMKNIVYAHSVGVIGGAERVTLATISATKNQFKAILFAPNGQALHRAAKEKGAKSIELSFDTPDIKKPWRTISQFIKYWKWLKHYRPRLVHTGDILALRNLQPVCRLLNIPMVCHVHFPYELSFAKWVFENRYPPAVFIFCSQELKDNIGPALAKFCPDSEQIVIHNGIDTDEFKPLENPPPNPIPRIGIIANLQYRKGHDDFLKMAQLLIDKGIKAQFDIIGGDILQEPREFKLKALSTKLGITEYVTFHGQLDNVRETLQKLDIIVCASHEEAFPITILEAMACAKPIVSTNVNGIPEAITDGKTGLLVAPHNPEALAMAVQKLIECPELKLKFAENALNDVRRRFSKAIFCKDITTLYGKLLS